MAVSRFGPKTYDIVAFERGKLATTMPQLPNTCQWARNHPPSHASALRTSIWWQSDILAVGCRPAATCVSRHFATPPRPRTTFERAATTQERGNRPRYTDSTYATTVGTSCFVYRTDATPLDGPFLKPTPRAITAGPLSINPSAWS